MPREGFANIHTTVKKILVQTLEKCAKKENRTPANMLETLLKEGFEKRGFKVDG